VATAKFEGYKGIFHGGIVASLLDEVMIKAILAHGIFAVTAEMTVRFQRPIHIGDHIRLAGNITSQKGRRYETAGKAIGDDGEIYATATGIYLEAKKDLKQELIPSLE
jgi:uncharacterized protein (TIGR00369 family)